MSIFERVRQLGFPIGEYVVVGSAIMEVCGIRKTNDLDIVVTPALFERCKQAGWSVQPWTKPGKKGEWLKKDDCDILLDCSYGDAKFDASDLIREAEVYEGIPFMGLERLIVFKRAYGREKDAKDIDLIEKYLAKI